MNVAVVQARMNSSRLHGKVMLPLAGEPMIWHIIERIKRAKMIDRICVATTCDSSDDALAEYCRGCNVDVVRGSINDVLARYIQAAYVTKADLIVRCTGDNPLIHPACIDAEIEYLVNNPSCDYVSMRGLPIGTMSEAFTVRTLERLNKLVMTEYDSEHVTSYIRVDSFQKKDFLTAPELSVAIRLTVDTIDDYERMCNIYDKLYRGGSIIELIDTIQYLAKERND